MVDSGNRLSIEKALRVFSGMFDALFVLFLQLLLTHMLLAIVSSRCQQV